MKALLMHRDCDFDMQQPLPWNEPALVQDLALGTLLGEMARNDKLVREVSLRALLTGWTNDTKTILYRQAVVQDCQNNPRVLRELYDLTVEVIERRKRHFGIWGHYPSSVLYSATEMMKMYVDALRRLRAIVLTNRPRFASDGFDRLFVMLDQELGDEYLDEVEKYLGNLKFGGGTLISAELGAGNAGRNHVLRQQVEDERHWLLRLFVRRLPAHSFRLAERDEAGARALSELRDRSLNTVANALAQSADHVDSFFQTLRAELAFYVGCLNVWERLFGLDAPTCFPRPVPVGEPRRLHSRGLYDPCLALQMQRRVMGSTLDADSKSLVIITGANQGGKSVFLRSVGVAQLMMQCGMFVGAESFQGEVGAVLVTHYRHEEDPTLKSGRFDEELTRMSSAADHLTPNTFMLFNESFGATNEREGSEIARQVVSALLERRIKVFFVTHLYAFAHSFFERADDKTLFLRAGRRADGTPTLQMVEGEPLATSHGKDLYYRIFATGT